ncbi:Ras guanine nucleotide exchange factor Q [Pelomyxa schiedti]|nr:Ras guanine nucleotide exchange factor Q [Pelomyxa schiedti]
MQPKKRKTVHLYGQTLSTTTTSTHNAYSRTAAFAACCINNGIAQCNDPPSPPTTTRGNPLNNGTAAANEEEGGRGIWRQYSYGAIEMKKTVVASRGCESVGVGSDDEECGGRQRAMSEPPLPHWEYAICLMERGVAISGPATGNGGASVINTEEPICPEIKPDAEHSCTAEDFIAHLCVSCPRVTDIDTLLLTHKYFMESSDLFLHLVNQYSSPIEIIQTRVLDIIKRWAESHSSILQIGDLLREFIRSQLYPKHAEWGTCILECLQKNIVATIVVKGQSVPLSPSCMAVESKNFQEVVETLWLLSPIVSSKKRTIKTIKKAFYADEIIRYTIEYFPFLNREQVIALGNSMMERGVIKCKDKSTSVDSRSRGHSASPEPSPRLPAPLSACTPIPLTTVDNTAISASLSKTLDNLSISAPLATGRLSRQQHHRSLMQQRDPVATTTDPNRYSLTVSLALQSSPVVSTSCRFSDAPTLYSFSSRQHSKTDWPKPIGPKSQRPEFTDLHPLEVARQLTLLESQIFLAISTCEFMRQGWNSKDESERLRKSPNICKMITHTNFVSQWVSTEIVLTPNTKQRVCTVRRFIQIAQLCKDMNNWTAYYAIGLGLGSFAITRLKKTWQSVPKIEKQFLEDLLADVLQPNMSNYRSNLQKCGLPVVPYIALWMKDLTFIEDGNPDYATAKLVNWDKMRMIASILQKFQQCQSAKYKLKPQQDVANYISHFTVISNPEQLAEKSRLCESST